MTNTTRTPLTYTSEAAAWMDAHKGELRAAAGPAEIQEATYQGKRPELKLPTGDWRTRENKGYTGTRTMPWYRLDGTFIGAPAPATGDKEYKFRGAATIRELPILERINRNNLKQIFNYRIAPTYTAFTGRVRKLSSTTSTVEVDVTTFFLMKNAQNHRKSNGLRADDNHLSLDSSPVAVDHMRQLMDHNSALNNLLAEADVADDKAFLLKVLGLLSPTQLQAIQEKAAGTPQTDKSGKTLKAARKAALNLA